MTATLDIAISLASKITFASHQNSVPILRELKLTNTGEEPLVGLLLELQADPPYITPKRWMIDRISPGETTHITDRDIILNGGLLFALTESMVGTATVRATWNDELLAEAHARTAILARHEWGGVSSMPELLAAFVLPNDPAIERILKSASLLLAASGKPDGIDGYTSGSRSRAWELASAIWSAVCEQGISYALPPASFESAGQKIRVPGAILESGLATCLDTSLLFAAALEQAGLNPIIVLIKGHAFAGCWLQREEFASLNVEESETLRKRVSLQELIVFETTMATHKPPPSFSQAIAEGLRHLGEDRESDFVMALDISRARMQRLRPVAIPLPGQHSDVAVNVRPAPIALEGAPLLPMGDIATESTAPLTPAGRLDQWQRKLLDLTVRNRLLNVRPTATSIEIFCPDPAKLEDKLAAGGRIRIVSSPALEGASGRDMNLHFSRTGERADTAYARDALDRNEVLSPLEAKLLDANLVELYRKARLDMLEGGANTLFLALGFLLWRKSGDETRAYRAPLVLVPVKLERRSANSGVRMVLHEDEPRFNLTLLQMLRQDFELHIPDLEDKLPVDDSGVDVPKVWNIVRRAIRDMKGFEVVEDIMLGTFSFAKYLMWKDLVDRTDQLKSNAVVRHLLESPREPFRQEGSLVDPRSLDVEVDPAGLFTPLPADSSQLSAVIASARGCHFVLDGPPGTGKSQTIANIIAHNMAMGRKVLFVAEKMAALDVVYRRLNAQGLGAFCLELHSNKANKADVLAQLNRAWDTRDQLAEDEWALEAQRLRNTRDELNEIVRLLHLRHENGLTLHQAIGRTVRDTTALTPVLHWPPHLTHDKAAYNQMRDLARRLELNYKAIASLDRAAFSTIIETNWSNAWQSELLSVIGTLADEIAATDAARAALQSALGLEGVAQDAAGLRALAVLADILPGGYGRDLAFAFVPNAATIIEHVETAAALVDNYVETERRLSVPYGPEACRRIQVADLRTRQAEAEASYWPMSFLRGRSIRKDLSAQGGCSALPDTGADLPILADLVKYLAALDLLGAETSTIPTWDGTRTRTSMLRDLLDYAKELRLAAAALASSPDALITIRSALRKVTVDGNELLAEAMPIARAAASYATAHSRMALALERYAALSGTAIEDNADFIQSVRDICSTLKHEQQAIKSWCDWVRTRDEASHMDMQAIIAAVEADAIGIKGAIDAFETAYSRWWASARIDEESALRRFVSAEHADKIQLFRELDDKVSRLSARLVRARICATIPARDDVAKSSAYGVLRHQMQLQRPRKAVRELVQEAGDALTTLTPCLLMSPLSIAQYLPPNGALFDLVIFDEASQITTWDAIGAIARGKQTIIAGDPKQMPPTSFFDRAAGHAADADADVEEDQESILDECLAASIPQHRLTWHYRSRHESLIAFSNHRYYGGELVTFPAPVTRDSAVQLVPVVGSYARGKGRTNQAEAQAMVHEVVRRLQDPAFVDATGKRLSLAVVTLNSEQQRLVEDLLDKERQANPALEPFFSDDLSEPVVVKNLETVQGDERDLILLGIGYGPETPGAPTMAMNFGPLNRMGGWRRLNVAITRAREELLVFASFPPHMVDLNRTSAEAVRDMKHYLEFAQKGPSALSAAVQGSVGDHESPFEEAVANRLRDKGWSIVPQIGVSKYRIDLGVVHPDRPGDYLLGIECDGASYHSAATARDRDKIRAAVLQSLGWRLARIWSTDWWIDPAGAAERLSAIIQKTLEDSRSESPAGTLTPTAADQSAAPEGECLTQSADNTEPPAALPVSGVSMPLYSHR